MATDSLKTYRRPARGSILVLIAFSLVALIAMVTLVIDFGFMYSTKAQLQNAADAAALAGVALLDGSDSTTQTAARTEASLFAAKNSAAGIAVNLGSNGGNSDTGDIQVGNWDPTLTPKFLTTRKPVNAVKIIARRTAESGNAVNTIMGKVLNILSLDVSTQSIAALALSSPPLLLCAKAPNLPTTTFEISPNLPAGTSSGTAWTMFFPSTSVNSNELKTYNYEVFSDYCSRPCIGTTNGNIQPVLEKLKTTYDTHKAADGTWKIPIPIVDGTCTLNDGSCPASPTACTDPDPGHTEGCPPGKQGNTELYHIAGWAEATVTAVYDSGNPRGFVASVGGLIRCDSNPLGTLGRPRLVY